jgi:nitrogen fixation-related uncharacterized protein
LVTAEDATTFVADSDPPSAGSRPSALPVAEGEIAMTIVYIVAGIVILAAFLYWGFRSEQKEAHHLDELHIVPPATEEPKKKQAGGS